MKKTKSVRLDLKAYQSLKKAKRESKADTYSAAILSLIAKANDPSTKHDS
jgi:hypothetical protein